METSSNFTDKELAQLRSIIGENPHKALEFMHECAEIAGVVDKKFFADTLGLKPRTVQDQCKNNKLKCFVLSGVKYPASIAIYKQKKPVEMILLALTLT